jgi:SAM-dependent methyltransferase
MNWKLKALCQSGLSLVPGSATINYWAQKWVTRAYSDFAGIIRDKVEKARWFAEQFDREGAAHLEDAQFYEFGGGWHLAGPLALYSLGVNRQIVDDLTRCVQLELVNRAIDELNRDPGPLFRRPGAPLGSLDELSRRFGIEYRAPADARRTGLPSGFIDCVTNTYTFEHIPPADVRAIMQECRRILKPGGTMLSMIDYQDHYSYRDSNISVYNFLQFSSRQWRWFNSSLHYQSRMRHCEYRRMFQDAGLDVASEELIQPTERDLRGLASIPLAAEFGAFARQELLVLGSKMVCCAGARTSIGAQGGVAAVQAG